MIKSTTNLTYTYNNLDNNTINKDIIHKLRNNINIEKELNSLNITKIKLKYNSKTKIKFQSKYYYYNDCIDTINELNTYSNILKSYLLKLNIPKVPVNLLQLTEGLTRGVSTYIKENYKLNHPVSNGFIKLWEIYHNTSNSNILEIVKKGNINTFHMAEAPGQWVHSTDYYIYKELINNKDVTQTSYNWYANALNPYNPKNIAIYGTGIFKDDYGFIGKYPNRWLYGSDGTGDITNVNNIKWFRNFLHNEFNNKQSENNFNQQIDNGNLQLITGDGGILGDLILMQKLDLAQVIMVLACSMKGGNCVIKHFTPFLNSKPESYNSLGLYLNMLYLYYYYFNEIEIIKPETSNSVSGEFYVIGKGFKGITESELNKLYKHLENFKVNECFIDKSIIDNDTKFFTTIVKFIKEMYEIIIIIKQIRIILLDIILKSKTKQLTSADYKYKKYINQEWIKSFLDKNIKQWIEKYNFN